MEKRGVVIAGLVLGLPVVLVFGLMMFITQVEEEYAASCAIGYGAGGNVAAANVDMSTMPDGPIAGYSGEQLVNAARIMLVAKKRGLSLRDQQIGVMAAMGESSLTNPDHGDAVRNDTIGLFQIGPEHGAHADRMNPDWAAGNFFDRLLAVEGYQTLAPTIAAHRAQRNADPYHYERFWGPAGEVIGALSGVKEATAPVVPANAGGAPSSYNLGPVQPQLTHLVNVLGPMFGIQTIGGYRESATDPNGHPAGLAADFMVPMTPQGKAQGDALVAYAQQHAVELKVDYIIWYQRIWSVGRSAEGWRPMEDRGSPTANHMDHPHINVLPTGATAPGNVVLPAGGATGCPAPAPAQAAWQQPLAGTVLTEYGQIGGTFHDGIDYAGECGTPFAAASSGMVVKAGPDPVLGHVIEIQHANGVRTRYGHMFANGVLVRVGQQVTVGETIGTVGKAGQNVERCALHLSILNDGATVDPLTYDPLAAPISIYTPLYDGPTAAAQEGER